MAIWLSLGKSVILLPWQVKKTNSHFADFGQVQLLLEWLLLRWLLLGWLLLRWLILWWLLLILSLCKIPLGETGCLGSSYFLFSGCISIQFFCSPLKQSVRPPIVTYPSLYSICVTYRTLCDAISHKVLPTQPLPREAEDFRRAERHFNHVSPLIYW